MNLFSSFKKIVNRLNYCLITMRCLRSTVNCRSIIFPCGECLADFRNPRGSRYAKLCQAGWTRICASHANGYDQHRNTAGYEYRLGSLRRFDSAVYVFPWRRARRFRGRTSLLGDGSLLASELPHRGIFLPALCADTSPGFSFSFDFKVKYRGNHRVRECMSCEMCRVAHASSRIWINLFSCQCRDSRERLCLLKVNKTCLWNLRSTVHVKNKIHMYGLACDKITRKLCVDDSLFISSAVRFFVARDLSLNINRKKTVPNWLFTSADSHFVAVNSFSRPDGGIERESS